MVVSASKLRANIYRLLDEVLEKGYPVEVMRKKKKILLIPAEPVDRLKHLKPHPNAWVGDLEDAVHMDWSDEWRPG